MPYINIKTILRISKLNCLPEKPCISATEQFLYRILATLHHLFLMFLVIIHTWPSVTIQIKGHSYHFHRTTCVPSLLQTLRLHTSVLEIIYFVDMISGILIDSKAIMPCDIHPGTGISATIPRKISGDSHF